MQDIADDLKAKGARAFLSSVPLYVCVYTRCCVMCAGNAKLSKGAIADAVALYTAAIDAFPASPTVHVLFSNRAAAHSRLGSHEKALADAK